MHSMETVNCDGGFAMQKIGVECPEDSVSVCAEDDRVMRLRSLLECLGVGRSTVYDRINPNSPRYDASFPRPIRLSGAGGKAGAVGWLSSDVSRWLAARVADQASRIDRQRASR